METMNQDAMLNERSQTYNSETDGQIQTTDQTEMPGQDHNPIDLAGDANTLPTTPANEDDAANDINGTGAASGSPNMEPDVNNYGNGDSLGNNDGTEPSPEMTDPMYR